MANALNNKPEVPMNLYPIRKALGRYLQDLDIAHDVGDCVVNPTRFLDDKWHEINETIEKLGGSWIKATKHTQGHWRIPK